MQYTLLLNALSFLAIAIICALVYYRSWSVKGCTFGKLLGLISIFYLASAFLNFLWFMDILEWSPIDSVIVGSAFIMPVAAILLVTLLRITGNKKLLFYFFIFVLALFGFSLRPLNFFLLIIVLSFLLMMLISIEMQFAKQCLRKSSVYAILYGFLSLLLVYFILEHQIPPVWFIPNLFLLVYYSYFLADFKSLHDCKLPSKSKETQFTIGVKYVIFIVTILAFLLVAIVAVHEIGHGLVAQLFGCQSQSVIYGSQATSPFTEVTCPTDSSYPIIAISGILLPVLVGALLMLSGGGFMKNIGILVVSLSFFITYQDFVQLSLSVNYIIIIYLFSFVFMITAVLRLANEYLSSVPFDEEKKAKYRNHDS
jgi:hypothetical protein